MHLTLIFALIIPISAKPPVRTDFVGCFGGAANDTQAMFVDPDMTNDLCLEHCGELGLSVSATRGQICTVSSLSCEVEKVLFSGMLKTKVPDTVGPRA